MNKKAGIRDGILIGLGILIFLAMAVRAGTTYVVYSYAGYYVPFWERIFNREMFGNLAGILLGIGLIVFGRKSIVRRRYSRLIQSVIAHQEWIEVKDLAREIGCSSKKTVKYVKKMQKTGELPQGTLDEQEGLLMLSEKIRSDYKKAWDQWQMQQRRYQLAGITLEQQEKLLEGKKTAQNIQVLSKQVRSKKIQALLYQLGGKYLKDFNQAQKEPAVLPELEQTGTKYLAEVEQMAVQYIQMEKLDRDVENTESARRLEDFLGRLL